VSDGVRSSGFYNSKTWKTVRNSYLIHAGGQCERCGLEDFKHKRTHKDYIPFIVHHKIPITMQDIINNYVIRLYDYINLELLCQDCHNKEHKEKNKAVKEGLTFDENGDLVLI